MKPQTEQKIEKKNKTVFATIFSSLVIVLVVEILLMLGTVFGTQIPQRLKKNAEQIVTKQIENRAGYLENALLEAQDLQSLVETVVGKTEGLLETGTLTVEQLNSTMDTTELFRDLSDDLIVELRKRPVTGIFVVLNTHDINIVKNNTDMPGIYLRDLDPDAPDSARNEDLSLEFSSPYVVQSMKIYTDACWRSAYQYTIDTGAFVYKPFQAAYRAKEQLSYDAYGYWTHRSFRLPGDSKDIVTYSVPLILSDGTVVGVAGIEMQSSYIMSKLPYEELQYGDRGSYLLSYKDKIEERDVVYSVVKSTENEDLLQESSFELTKREGDGDSTKIQGTEYYVYSTALSLYSRNAPFSDNVWMLTAAIPLKQLYGIAYLTKNLFIIIAVMMLILGVGCSFLISRKIASPMKRLSDEITDFEQVGNNVIPELSATGIRELDNFADAFTKRSKDVLDASTRFLRIMEMASIDLGGYEVRRSDQSVYVTDNYFSMLGIEYEEKEPLTLMKFNRMMVDFYAGVRIASHLENGNKVFEIRQKDGEIHYISFLASMENGLEIGLVEDVTEAERERQQLEYDRDYDVLTGLYNRRAFLARTEELLREPKQVKHGAVMMFDLDNLKKINDTYGHDWGDNYIRLASRYIRENLPDRAICSRFSGDEFFAFVYGFEEADDLVKVLQEFFMQSGQYYLEAPDGANISLSASCGISRYPEDSRDFTTLRNYADFALYQVKHGEKGKSKTFDVASYHKEQHEIQMNWEFQQMLHEGSIAYHFQPIFAADTGRVMAYEALMRGQKEALKSPGDILRIAHKQQKLYEIERLTVQEAAKSFLALENQKMVPKDSKVFINSISAVALTDEDFQACAPLLEKLRGRLVVEITEDEHIDYEVLEWKSRQLNGMAEFALDDYGSGYSNDANLIKLSPKYIKVDYGIVHEIDQDEDKEQIVRNIVAFAHQRDKKIIAEGIETREELCMLLSLGVDLLQGFFLCRPAAVPGEMAREAWEEIQKWRERKK